MTQTSYFADSIAALSSGALPAAIAVIRLSGPAVPAALDRLAGGCPPPRRACLRQLSSPDGEVLDSAVVIHVPGPASVTGEDVCEFQCHGGRAVAAAVLKALCAIDGVRLAEPGEFTRRAFINGRLDLVQAEALADLLGAETEAQRRLAVANSGGAQSRLYENWRAALLHERALIEAALDFSDEGDVSENIAAKSIDSLTKLCADIEKHTARSHQGELLNMGFRVVLAGAPNAGKSSLLNALAERDVAIVSDEPGTTRDVIDVRLDLGGYLVVVSDTAGLREAGAGTIERIGMERARARMEDADLVVFLDDGTSAAPVTEIDPARLLTIRSKSDLAGDLSKSSADLRVSAVTGEGLDTLLSQITERAAAMDVGDDIVVPTRERHRQELTHAARDIRLAIETIDDLTLVADHLRRASDSLGRLTGAIDVEDVLGAIFSRFCIGK